MIASRNLGGIFASLAILQALICLPRLRVSDVRALSAYLAFMESTVNPPSVIPSTSIVFGGFVNILLDKGYNYYRNTRN